MVEKYTRTFPSAVKVAPNGDTTADITFELCPVKENEFIAKTLLTFKLQS